MDSFLDGLPSALVPEIPEDLVDAFDAESIFSSGGLDNRSSDNGLSHLLKGGDSLSALKRRPASRFTTSAASRNSKSSAKSSRPSVPSRARQLKPDEADPFLSVMSVSPEVISTADQGLEDGATVQGRINTQQNDYINGDSLALCKRVGISGSSNSAQSPRSLVQQTQEYENEENILVNSPFKHSRRSKTKSQSPHPGKLLKDRTTSATTWVKTEISKQKTEDRKKAAGRLLKGRLKPMCPVKIAGPSMKHCRGIVADAQVYGPPPSRVKGQRDQMFDSILREYSDGDEDESIHPTSVASSESDRWSYQDITTGDYQQLVDANRLSSNPNIQISSPGEFSGFVQMSDRNVVVVVDRPQTAVMKSSSHRLVENDEIKRPVSGSQVEPNNVNKNVQFTDGVKNIRGKNSSKVETNEANDSGLRKANGSLSTSHNRDVKKSQPTRNSCKPPNLFQKWSSDNDESDDYDGENDFKPNSQKELNSVNKTSSKLNSGEMHHERNVENNSQPNDTRQASLLDDEIISDISALKQTKTDVWKLFDVPESRKPGRFKINVSSLIENRHIDEEMVSKSLKADCSKLVSQKTHVFNFVASQSICGDSPRDIEASHVSAEFNMTPRGHSMSEVSDKHSPLKTKFTFESLDAEINAVQNSIKDLIENKNAVDELETHRENNLEDLVLHVVGQPCTTVAICAEDESETLAKDLDDSDSEGEEVAVIIIDSDDDELARQSYREAQYSDILLSGDTTQCQIFLSTDKDAVKPTSCWDERSRTLANSHHTGKLHNDIYSRFRSQTETRSDSGCGSDLASVSHGDDFDRHADFLAELSEEEGNTNDDKKDVSSLKVVATAKDLMKMRKGKNPSLSANYPPLCFRINARPPTGKMYFFSYGTEMNPNRLSTYIRREIQDRLWGVLYGFKIQFNKRGVDVEAGGFPTVELDRGSSVEGCLYLLTAEELERLDRCVGYPEHYEHVMFPVWMSNCLDPDNYGVAQNCVPALMYIAQNNWIQTEGCLQSSYQVDQCLKSADLLSPAYREFLMDINSMKA